MFSLLQTLLQCGTLVLISFFVLLALPQCKLREMLLPFVGWALTVLCGIYCISPVDIVPEAVFGPFGLVDDLGALIMGIASARAAMNAGKGAT